MLCLRGVSKRFGEAWIFRGLNLEIARGESFVLLGPSGAGKSVLLRVAASLLVPDEGECRVSTQNVGMLFQRNALFDSLSVEENLTFPLRERKGVSASAARKSADALLEAVGLGGTSTLRIEELSGGMQKRLGIARALIVEPELIFYDEPTAGLDPITSRRIAELIIELRRKHGSTLVTVTTDIHRAYQLGERIALLADGKLIIGGTPAQTRATHDSALKQFIEGALEGPLSSGLV